jgi:hypothetical protein
MQRHAKAIQTLAAKKRKKRIGATDEKTGSMIVKKHPSLSKAH